MKPFIINNLSIVIILMAFTDHNPVDLRNNSSQNKTDTIPQVCAYLTPEVIETVQPFTHPLSKMFPDPDPLENFTGCYYQFYTEDEYPQFAISLVKWSSKTEAAVDFNMFFQSHLDNWGFPPERIYGIADSAFFGFNADDTTKCDICGLVAIQGVYSIHIVFKGQYDKVTRARKKESALKILQLMYDRIPGLSPTRIRNDND